MFCMPQFVSVARLLLFALIHHDEKESDNETDYIERFGEILKALREKRSIRICFEGRKGYPHTWVCVLHRLEYSAKDDKFRVLCTAYGKTMTINLSRMRYCELLGAYDENQISEPHMKRDTVVLHLTDERNALERVMLHFSHLQKETRRMEDGRYNLRRDGIPSTGNRNEERRMIEYNQL